MLRCCLTDRIRNYFEPSCLTLRVLVDSLHFLKRGAASFPLFAHLRGIRRNFLDRIVTYLEGVCERQANVHAVQDVSLTIDKGEIFGMIGFSGAGKSTLVRCINLLERPTSGKVIVDGQDMLSLSAKELRQARKKIGMIFQHFNLMPSRTVAGNVAYPLRGSGLSRQQIAERYSACLIWSHR